MAERVTLRKRIKAPVICTPEGAIGGKAMNDPIVDEVGARS